MMSIELYQRINTFNTPAMASLSSRYEKLLLSENHSDCVFLVGTSIFRCHKLVLSAASPVFDAMFFGSMREKDAIEICDMNPKIFQKLIFYVYTARLDLDSDSIEDVLELYYGAEKYLLNDLIVGCLNAVKQKLRFDNILPALELSFCINLKPLIQICTHFLTHCCLNDVQFMTYLKNNYFHITKDCVKAIISHNKDLKSLIWFVFEWCHHECEYLGLKQNDCELITEDLQLDLSKLKTGYEEICVRIKKLSNTVERSYYKACRPFKIDSEDFEWNMTLRSDRFISLLGLIIKSRLKPLSRGVADDATVSSNEYRENLQIEIRAKMAVNNETGNERVILQHIVDKEHTRYNCDLNIVWDDAVVLSPDAEYRVRLTWQTNAFGAEYPCSLQSDEVDGIQFKDITHHFGSIVKGLKFLNLVV
ncbi:uncharacterized protein LOC129906564 [Episyrphus balteatus]|uniref:uncharacterized protein LOC129906564 n=1 Tax=Episyrphus balteatus TaxID=286459 RepID=UPI002485907A|nr:uncharacterized protein LOC129906564 [Episyrphus balteatus]